MDRRTTPPGPLSENDLWLLSFYRSSELAGALFFGQLARTVNPGPLQGDITHHFADEANHARWWTECIRDLGSAPLKLRHTYQDQYLAAARLPANLMEVLAITQVFEKRAIGLYKRHQRMEGLHPRVTETLDRIMEDERWHIRYVRDALHDLAKVHGQEEIDATLTRLTEADKVVFASTMQEYGDRFPYVSHGSAGVTGVEAQTFGGVTVLVARARRPLPVDALAAGEAATHEALAGDHAQQEWRVGRRALRLVRAAVGLNPDTTSRTFPHPRLSLTHTADGAVAVALATDSNAVCGVGVDRERRREPSPGTARFFLTATEIAAAALSPSDRLRLWTVKEAIFKADPGNAGTVLTDYRVLDPAALDGEGVGPAGDVVFCYRSRWIRGGVETIAIATRHVA